MENLAWIRTLQKNLSEQHCVCASLLNLTLAIGLQVHCLRHFERNKPRKESVFCLIRSARPSTDLNWYNTM